MRAEYIYTNEYEAGGLFGGDLMEDIRTGDMFMRTKTYKYGRVLEAEIFPMWRNKRAAARAAKVKPTTAAMERINHLNTVKRISRYINANFTDQDLWATFGWDDDNLPGSTEAAWKELNNFLRRLKRAYKKTGAEFKALYELVYGCDIRSHVHMVLSGGVSREIIEEKWKGGGRKQTRALQPDKMGYTGLAHYFGKNKRCERKWHHTQNLILPQPTVADGKVTKRGAEKIIESADKQREYFEKLYPGYELMDIDVRYSEVVSGVYCYVTMSRTLCADCVHRKRGKCSIYPKEQPLIRRSCSRYGALKNADTLARAHARVKGGNT
ncbi:MAG: hypothetical protein IJV67_02535 [Clostridia bacterium]|nr:hypothetical protein [Clostridia bacterium]